MKVVKYFLTFPFFFFYFQRFKTSPTILVTASHEILNRPQDAMAVWVEDLNKDNFKVCLRETKILDGIHKEIRIVSD